MPLELDYERSGPRNRALRRVLAAIGRHRVAASVLLLVGFYVAAYGGLRLGRILVHQNYLRWDSDANPGGASGGTYVQEHDIGRGSNLDATGRPTVDPSTGVARAAFFPLIRAERWYWRHVAPDE